MGVSSRLGGVGRAILGRIGVEQAFKLTRPKIVSPTDNVLKTHDMVDFSFRLRSGRFSNRFRLRLCPPPFDLFRVALPPLPSGNDKEDDYASHGQDAGEAQDSKFPVHPGVTSSPRLKSFPRRL